MDAREAFEQVKDLREQLYPKVRVDRVPSIIWREKHKEEFEKYRTADLVTLLDVRDTLSSSIQHLCESAMKAGLPLKEYVDRKTATFDNNVYVRFQRIYPKIELLNARLKAIDDLIYELKHSLRKKRNPVTGPVSAEASETAEAEEGKYMFFQSGKGWKIRFNGGESFYMPESVGLSRLAKLLANPNKPISCEEFIKPPSGILNRNAPLDSELTIKPREGDDELYEQYPKKLLKELRALEAERDKNRGDHTPEGDMIAEDCQREIDQLTLRALKFKRPERTQNEKNKPWAISKSIKEAIKLIMEFDPELADHLTKFITLGARLSYHPTEVPPWILSRPEKTSS
jgi:hypothetical protein